MATTTSFNPRNIELVSFDIWNTLLHSNSDYTAQRAQRIEEAFGRPEVGMPFLDFLDLADDEIDATSDITGEQSGFNDRVNYFARKAGITELSEKALLTLHHEQFDLVTANPPKLAEPGLVETLEALSAHKKIAVTSNTGFIDGKIMRTALMSLGLTMISHFIFSNEVGASKPSEKMFNTVVEQSRISAERIVHIGDNHKADFEGPQRVGMHAIHLAAGDTIGTLVNQFLG